MTAIFGFLDEKCIEMEIFIITSWLFRIMTSLKLCQLYRDLYGKMAFWPQWRHQWEELKLQSPITREDKQLLRCVFFVRLVFMSTSKYLDRKKHGSSPLRCGTTFTSYREKTQKWPRKRTNFKSALIWEINRSSVYVLALTVDPNTELILRNSRFSENCDFT